MEIRVLRYFLAVAREGSITNASNSLHITQPTLSRQLKDLEDELGHKLFRRGSHNMSLTNEGFIFRKRAEEIIDLADKTENEFRAMG
ncbi:MAG: LysR family transcriptional regulator, partial [Synergistes sp.]|nr:LysR family transcriptional regulator [Synergistes sp.]